MTSPDRAEAALVLPEVLDLTAAAPLRSELLGRRGAPVTLDGSGVRRLGGLCLQVLLAGCAAWAADGAPFRLTNPSPQLRTDLGVLGAAALADCMEDPSR